MELAEGRGLPMSHYDETNKATKWLLVFKGNERRVVLGDYQTLKAVLLMLSSFRIPMPLFVGWSNDSGKTYKELEIVDNTFEYVRPVSIDWINE